jgi:hypothetical protein
MVNVSVEGAFFPTIVGENAVVSAVPTTENVAFAPAAVRPPPSALTLELLFVYDPSTLEVTSTRNWQLATAAFIAAPVAVIVPLPATAVTANPGAANPPPAGQLVCTLGTAAMNAFAGKRIGEFSPTAPDCPRCW